MVSERIIAAGRRVLVTGGAGFIGSQVAQAHLAQGDEVWIVDDLSAGRRGAVPDGAVLHEMDVADPRIPELIGDVRFDLVSHHAAQMDVRASVRDPAADAHTNVMGLINVLEGASRAGVDRVLFPSSGSVYADARLGSPAMGEDAPKGPRSPYAVSKFAGEHYLAFYRETRGLDSVTMRYGNVYGPGQDVSRWAGVVSSFCGRLVRGEPMIVSGDGQQSRDYVFVEDVVAANLVLADIALPGDCSVDGRAFNVSSGAPTTVNQIADLLSGFAGANAGRRHVEARAGEASHSLLSPAKLSAAGWSPSTALADGLGRTYAYVAGDPPPLRSA